MKHFFTLLITLFSITLWSQSFTTTWFTTTSGQSITIPTFPSETYNYSIDWGDGVSQAGVTGDVSHVYANRGSHTVTISGTFPRIYFNNTAVSRDMITAINSWGNIQWSSMGGAFYGCTQLTVPATDAPDLSNVTDMSNMFRNASVFNQDISHWNVSNVTNMSNMFDGATTFNQKLGDWDISNVTNMTNMLNGATLPSVNYDNTLIGWSTLDAGETQIPANITFSGGNSTFCNAVSARNALMSTYSWTITDGGQDCTNAAFITTWRTNNPGISNDDQITIQTTGTGYNYTVDWGDGTSDTGVMGDIVHTYPEPGVYTVSITGDFPRIFFNFQRDRGKILTVEQWGSIAWSSMGAAFHGCSNLSITATDNPDLSRVTTMRNMFNGALALNQNINHWDVSNVTDMANLFADARSFNQPLNNWDVSNVSNMNGMFRDARSFNQPINTWNVNNVTNMGEMFQNARSFNQPLNDWDVSSVTNMFQMFTGASVFNQSLNSWDVSNVTNMVRLFNSATVFDQPLNQWDVSNVTNMDGMFAGTVLFNQSLDDWDVSRVTNMREMFLGASTFDQDLGNWDIGNVTTMFNMFSGVTLSTSNYDNTLIGWTALDAGETQIPTNINFSGGNSTFCNSVNARNTLISTYSWTITDGGQDCTNALFITTWQTDNPGASGNNQITIPTTGTGYNYNVNWGDGNNDTGLTGNITHTYTTPGEYTVTIMGQFPRIFFNNTGDRQKLLTVEQWGINPWTSMANAFFGCSNLTITATDVPNLSNTSNVSNMFRDVLTFNQDIGTWDISNVTNMSGMFDGVSLSTFNYDNTLIGWATDDSGIDGDGIDDIPSGITFSGGNSTFCIGANAHNTLMSTYSWTITDGGLSCSEAFITTWQTDNPGASNDNQITIPTAGTGYNYNIDWGDNTSDTGVTGRITHTYDVPGTYTVSITGDFPRIFFSGGGESNKILTVEQWGSNPWTSMANAFQGCTNLIIPATDAPDLSNVTEANGMFLSARSLNENLNHWDVSNITNMQSMFGDTEVFNQPLDQWNVGNVTNMRNMFNTARVFNQPLSTWDVSRVTDMSGMFLSAFMFDQDLGTWDISSATNMSFMFNNISLSTSNYDNTLIGWATDTSGVDGDGIDDIPSGITFSGGNSTFCNGANAHNALMNTYSWTITDGGLSCSEAFITTWQTDNPGPSNDNQITIPTTGTGYNYNIDWGDGLLDTGATGNITHTYTTPGEYTVTITGQFPRIFFNSGGDRNKILTVEQWGVNPWISMANAFGGCTNLIIPATDAPDLSNVSDMSNMFINALAFNQDISSWDVSNVTDTRNMFLGAQAFNQPLNTWNVSMVTDMNGMFFSAEAFNQDLSNWDVSSVTNMMAMFQNAVAFNQPLNSWDTSRVEQMGLMFLNASAFNQPLNNWNVSRVLRMNAMFSDAIAFNQPLSDWDVSNVVRMIQMFDGATAFDQDLGNWDISSVTNMSNMFRDATLSTANYDNTLIGWATDASGIDGDDIDDIPNNITFSGGNSLFCDLGQAARNTLINTFGWTITDGGKDSTTNCATLSTDDVALAEIILYPNPTVSNLIIDNAQNSNLERARIYDVNGRLIYETELQPNNKSQRIDVSRLTAAIYFLRLDSDISSSTLRFVKQ